MRKVKTADDVREIRKRVAEGESLESVGKDFAMSYFGLRDIVKRKSWKWVGEAAREDVKPETGKKEKSVPVTEIDFSIDPHASRKDRWIPDDFPPFPEEWVHENYMLQSDRRMMWGILTTDALREKMKRIWGGSGEEFEVDEGGQPVG